MTNRITMTIKRKIKNIVNVLQRKGRSRDWALSFLHATILAIIMSFICWPMSVDGNSMEPSFQDNERIMMSRILIWLNRFSQDDFVVCKIEVNGKKKNIIKRVVGFPGDAVRIESQTVWINGIPYPDMVINTNNTNIPLSQSIDFILLENEYFILGDNKDFSYDSRQMGAISKENIVGKVILRFFPLNYIKTY